MLLRKMAMRHSLKDIAAMHNRYVPDDVQLVERNGYIFFVHPRLRFDPVTLSVLAITAAGVGTAVGISQTLQQGRQAEKIAKRRAEIDLENADAARKASVEEAKIEAEEGRRLRATQKSQAAAGGIRINQGVPLVIETETRAAIAKEIGFGLERGRAQVRGFEESAQIETAVGKAAKTKSRFQALQLGLQGAATIAFMGANLPGKATPGTISITDAPTRFGSDSRFLRGGITRNFP